MTIKICGGGIPISQQEERERLDKQVREWLKNPKNKIEVVPNGVSGQTIAYTSYAGIRSRKQKEVDENQTKDSD